jgi:hypothetical protein
VVLLSGGRIWTLLAKIDTAIPTQTYLSLSLLLSSCAPISNFYKFWSLTQTSISLLFVCRLNKATLLKLFTVHLATVTFA